ncbi:MAG: bifunctional 4-hydroxy-2-oxoglutarate aldolase/2-dehydro-3-deoxy-phosphogluconate aldolase [Lachnospiraceae bacterium]
MNQVLEEFSNIGIIPVIALEDAADAVPLAKALIDGGLPCAEVTFRTDAAEESIRLMAKTFPEMLVGAGTVLTTEQVDRAVAAGARFIVSPGLNPKIVAYCLERNIPITPGCSNPSDVEAAIELGLDVVKFFPAEASGGLAMIKAMAAPYTKMKFMPTGGITAKNLKEYLAFGKIIACGGSWMVSKELIEAKDWDKIAALTAEAVSVMLDFKIAHVGINQSNEEEAIGNAQKFASFFQTTEVPGSSSIFVNGMIEVLKSNYKGRHGHIAIETSSIPRAMYHLKKRGFTFDETSAKYGKDHTIKAIYLNEDIAGHALHLLQK